MYALISCLFDKRIQNPVQLESYYKIRNMEEFCFKKIKTANSWAVELELAQVVCVSGHYLLIVHALSIAQAWPFSFSQHHGELSPW